MREVTADPNAFVQRVGGGTKGTRELIVKPYPIVDEIANPLDQPGSAPDPAELAPGEVAQGVAVAIAARHQKDERVAWQLLDRGQRQILRNLVGQSAVADGEVARERGRARGRGDPA